jgi:Sulfotransferase family
MITSVGRIAATIPQVRFVFMRRDREDLALRILMRRYRAGNHYAYSIRTIYEYITRHDQLTDLWLRTFPNLAIAVRYEDLVTQPQATLARVAELCGTAVNAASVPGLGDDRNCSLPYRDLMAEALSHEVSRSD